MTTIVWLRQDMRLADNPAWHEAAASKEPVVALHILPRGWLDPGISGLDRLGGAKAGFLHQCLTDLQEQLASLSVPLVSILADPVDVIEQLSAGGNFKLITSAAQAPEEQHWLACARACDIELQIIESQCLFSPSQALPAGKGLPPTFSRFRRYVEGSKGPEPSPPVDFPAASLNGGTLLQVLTNFPDAMACLQSRISGNPNASARQAGGETAAREHLASYLSDIDAVRDYKTTRNRLVGEAFSSRLSGYLSTGALSARTIWHALLEWESEHGNSDGSYWLRFELLWREYFHWSLRQHGSRLFAYSGLAESHPQQHPPLSSRQREYWSRWCNADTGLPCIDAPLRELMQTGWTSNRARQLLASFLVYEMQLDWRWGAEFFQHYLIDDDVASNWGNWAYIAGVGHDARGGRQFRIVEQTFRHDPDAIHIRTWLPQLADISTEKLRAMHRPDQHAGPATNYPRPMLWLEAPG